MSTYATANLDSSESGEDKQASDSRAISIKQVNRRGSLPNDPSRFASSVDTLPASTEPGVSVETGVARMIDRWPTSRFNATSARRSKFMSLQRWEGVVLEILAESFIARLVDKSCVGPDEEAEFSLEEISEDDKELLAPGSVFYWHIGYHDSPSGQRTRASIIRFRRLPSWTEQEIEEAQRRAQEIGELIGWK